MSAPERAVPGLATDGSGRASRHARIVDTLATRAVRSQAELAVHLAAGEVL